MKKSIFLFISILFLNLNFFSQDSILILPDVITYIPSTSACQKQIITKEQIDEQHCTSLTQFLETQGIQILSYGAYGLEQKPSIRGFTDETVRVVIDDICVNNPQYGTFDFSTISIDDIEKIEIIRGGFTEDVIFEGAVAGVIYITTKKPRSGIHFYDDFYTKTYFNENNFLDTFSESIGLSIQTSGSSFFKINEKITQADNQYLFLAEDNKVKERENSSVLDSTTDLKFTKYFGNGNSFSISELFYYGNKKIPGDENKNHSGTQKDYNNKIITNVIFPEKMQAKINLAYLYNLRFYTENDDFSKHTINSILLNSSANIFSNDFYNQDIGISLEYTKLDSTNDGNHNQFMYAVKETSVFYISNNYVLSIPLCVKGSTDNFAFIPKIGLSYQKSDFSIGINGYRMIQFPNMDDLYWDDGMFKGNPNLKPEDGWGAELVVKSENKIIPLNLNIYTNYYENKIQWNLSSNKPENIASAFYFGINAQINKSLFNEKLMINANLEYLYTKLLDKKNEVTYGKKIMWTPDLTASLNLIFNHNNFKATLNTNYVGLRYLQNTNIKYLNPYFTLNFGAEYLNKIMINDKEIQLVPYLKLENITNTDYEAVVNYPMPLINLSLGLKIQI